MENTKNRKKNLILTMVIVCLAFVIFKGFGMFLDRYNLNYYTSVVIKEAVFIAAAVAAAVILKKVYTLKFTAQGFGTGLLTGIYFIIMAIVSAGFGLFMVWVLETMTASAGDILLLVLGMLMVGIAEELLFRGILQNAFHEYLGNDSVKNVRLAILFTAVFFGFCHIFNVLSGASLSGAAIQAIANIPNGMLFGAIYYRSRKNLWVCILLHAFYDLGSNIAGGALNGTSAGSQVSNYSMMSLAFAVVVLLIALFITRGKKVRPLLDH